MNDRYNRPSPSPYRRSDDRRRPTGNGRPANQRSSANAYGVRRPEGARPSQKPQNARPVRRAAQRSGKRTGNILLKWLKGIAFVFIILFAGIGKLFSGLNRKLDVFRRSETSAVIVNCILGGVLTVILLCVFLLCKPGIDASRARSLAANGKSSAALKLVSALEDDGYPADKLLNVRLDVAERFMKNEDFDAVDSLLNDMNADANKQALANRSSYGRASALYESGDYAGAAQLFYQLNDYQDSSSRYADCRCALAIEAWQKGDETSARSLLLDVPDVAQRVVTAAQKVTGNEAEAQRVLSAELFQADSLNRMEQTMQQLNAARSDMPNGRIAVGRYHTVGLKSDGTVLYTGDNSLGQLNVAGWSNISQLAAGAFHTVALCNNGTVLATGNNSYGQCNVSEWTDVVAIAAGTCDTIGLKRDGTIVACGKNSETVSSWHGASFVTAGSYSLACLYDKGSMLASHPGAQMPLGVTLYDLSVCGPVSVGVLYDGSITSTFEGVPAWTDMVSVTACETGILGIGVDGQVKSHFYRPADAVEISVNGTAVEVESSGTHHVVLTSDGRVYAFGDNLYGQCEVSGWQL